MTKPDDRTPNPGSGSQASGGVRLPEFESADWWAEVRKGNIAGHVVLERFGRSDSVSTSSWTHLNPDGTNNWQLQGGSPIRIAGGNAADSSTGSGARQITVEGLNNSLQPVQVQLATNGTSPSAPAGTFFRRFNGAYVSQAGTYAGNNVGDVVIEASDGSTQFMRIPAGTGQSANGNVSTATNRVAFLVSALLTVDANKSVSVRTFAYDDIDNTTAPFKGARQLLIWTNITEPLFYKPQAPIGPFPEESDFWWEALSDSQTATVSVEFELLVVNADLVAASTEAFAEQRLMVNST